MKKNKLTLSASVTAFTLAVIGLSSSAVFASPMNNGDSYFYIKFYAPSATTFSNFSAAITSVSNGGLPISSYSMYPTLPLPTPTFPLALALGSQALTPYFTITPNDGSTAAFSGTVSISVTAQVGPQVYTFSNEPVAFSIPAGGSIPVIGLVNNQYPLPDGGLCQFETQVSGESPHEVDIDCFGPSATKTGTK